MSFGILSLVVQGGLGAIPPQDIECVANEGYVIVDQIWDCSYGGIAPMAALLNVPKLEETAPDVGRLEP